MTPNQIKGLKQKIYPQLKCNPYETAIMWNAFVKDTKSNLALVHDLDCSTVDRVYTGRIINFGMAVTSGKVDWSHHFFVVDKTNGEKVYSFTSLDDEHCPIDFDLLLDWVVQNERYKSDDFSYFISVNHDDIELL